MRTTPAFLPHDRTASFLCAPLVAAVVPSANAASLPGLTVSDSHRLPDPSLVAPPNARTCRPITVSLEYSSAHCWHGPAPVGNRSRGSLTSR
jgi:hypothetical protein